MYHNNEVYIYSSMSRSAGEIHDLFNRLARKLNDQIREMSREITNWHDTQIRRIDDHAREQQRLLEVEYQKQESYLKNTCQQFADAARPYELTRDNYQIDQLLVRCNALKYELAALEFSECSILFIQFMTDEKLAQKKRNEQSGERIEDKKSRNKTDEDYANYTANNPTPHGSSSSKLVFTNTKQTNQRPELTKCTDTPARSSGSNDNRSCDAGSDNTSLDECPVCLMSFPSHMTQIEQVTHVNAHF